MLDRGFASTLENAGLSIGEVTEDEWRVSYPVLNEAGELLRTIYLDKTDGQVKVEKPGEGSQLLSMAIDGLDISGKKKLWTCPSHCLTMVS